MKKMIIGILSLGLVVLGGAAAYAQSNESNGEGMFNFGQMSKIMEVVHPDQSEEELKAMYNEMHGTNGAAPSANFKNMRVHMGSMGNLSSENLDEMNQMHQAMHGELSDEDIEMMNDFMKESNGDVNFEQMKKMMQEIHPEFTNEQMKEMYNVMHGTNGAAPCVNFNGKNE